MKICATSSYYISMLCGVAGEVEGHFSFSSVSAFCEDINLSSIWVLMNLRHHQFINHHLMREEDGQQEIPKTKKNAAAKCKHV